MKRYILFAVMCVSFSIIASPKKRNDIPSYDKQSAKQHYIQQPRKKNNNNNHLQWKKNSNQPKQKYR